MLTSGSCRLGLHRNAEHQGEIERTPAALTIPNRLHISRHSGRILSGGRVILKGHLVDNLKCQAREF